MDRLANDMDFLVKHWGAFPRQFPAPFRLATTDFLRGKADWVRTRFQSCNFSLILRGRGEYRRGGRVWQVQAPCVLTQWPGEYLEYGPPIPDETWDELYLIYDARLFERFKQARLIVPNLPVWSIANLAAVEEQADELRKLTQSPHPERVADLVDRVCERLILETRRAPAASAEEEPALARLIAEVRCEPGKAFDFDALARRHGMSVSTFRRRWLEMCKVPPARYLQRLRLREACRLLVESTLAVGEVAREVGFEDELYFSRRFRKETGMAPSDYRRVYRLQPGRQCN